MSGNNTGADRDVVVIGAGIAGLIAARILIEAGANVAVVDKGRGVGGRLATRRFAEARFDHGAQFITTRDAWFRGAMEQWVDSGAASEWFTSGRKFWPVGFLRVVPPESPILRIS